MYEVLKSVLVQFSVEIVAGSFILGIRWVEKRKMKRKYRVSLRKRRND